MRGAYKATRVLSVGGRDGDVSFVGPEGGIIYHVVGTVVGGDGFIDRDIVTGVIGVVEGCWRGNCRSKRAADVGPSGVAAYVAGSIDGHGKV